MKTKHKILVLQGFECILLRINPLNYELQKVGNVVLKDKGKGIRRLTDRGVRGDRVSSRIPFKPGAIAEGYACVIIQTVE